MSHLCSAQQRCHLSPHCDTDPIALNLKNTFCGFPNSPKWAEGGAILINKLLTLNGNKPINPGDKFVQSKSGLQKLAYNVLMDSHYNLDFKKHMIERISTLFRPFVLDWNCIQFSNSISALQPFNSGNVMTVIKDMDECVDHFQQNGRGSPYLSMPLWLQGRHRPSRTLHRMSYDVFTLEIHA